ncbi:MAG: hypothetical protein ACOYLO_09225 [Ferruginibacter sp.]
MKKIVLTAAVIVTVFALTSCGASRKTGCPMQAQIQTNITQIA